MVEFLSSPFEAMLFDADGNDVRMPGYRAEPMWTPPPATRPLTELMIDAGEPARVIHAAAERV